MCSTAAHQKGWQQVESSQTRTYLFGHHLLPHRTPRSPIGWLHLTGVTRNNLNHLNVGVSVRCVYQRDWRFRFRKIQSGESSARGVGGRAAWGMRSGQTKKRWKGWNTLGPQ